MVGVLLLKGFFWSLLSHLLFLISAVTTLSRSYWLLPSGPSNRVPVIFVHGLYHNRTAWFFYLRWFRKWGWQHLSAITLRGKLRSIKDYEQMLAVEVERVLAETGSRQVDLVGHSMGGLIIRCYLADDSAEGKVRRVVTLGSPHAGSKLAVFGLGKAVKEMRPGSSLLESLNRADPQVPQNGLLYAVYTITDNMVLPNDSAMLTGPGVSSLETRVVDHVGLLYCKQTALLVRQCLETR
jgi:pimeloyl-ACP methyl ester carboxylesterase